jgi:hypothetical protein
MTTTGIMIKKNNGTFDTFTVHLKHKDEILQPILRKF